MTYKIYPLKNGACTIPGRYAFDGGDESEIFPYSLYVWLVTGGERPILVDAGLRDVAEMNRGAAHVMADPIVQKPEERVTEQLARKGVAPEDIGIVFITHLHFDHVDELDLFTNARIVVSKRGLDAATAFPGWQGSWAPHVTLEGLTQTWKERVIATDDAEIVPGIRTFWIGGHSPCSQAISVRTAGGTAVLTGDTVSLLANIEKDIPVGVAYNKEECRKAMQRIRAEADIVLPSHDPNVFERFPNEVIG